MRRGARNLQPVQNDFCEVRKNVGRRAYRSELQREGRARGSLCATRGPEGRLLPSPSDGLWYLRPLPTDPSSPSRLPFHPFSVFFGAPSCPHGESSRLDRAGGGGSEEGREKGLGYQGVGRGESQWSQGNERREEPWRGDRVEGE